MANHIPHPAVSDDSQGIRNSRNEMTRAIGSWSPTASIMTKTAPSRSTRIPRGPSQSSGARVCEVVVEICLMRLEIGCKRPMGHSWFVKRGSQPGNCIAEPSKRERAGFEPFSRMPAGEAYEPKGAVGSKWFLLFPSESSRRMYDPKASKAPR